LKFNLVKLLLALLFSSSCCFYSSIQICDSYLVWLLWK